MKVKYFAWVRERTGVSEEEIQLPEDVVSAGDLMQHLAARDEGYAAAFETPEIIRVAVDLEHRPASTDIREAKEVAFFPPMTGG